MTATSPIPGGGDTDDAHATWVLADDRTGNVNQCIGVAEALDRPFIVKTLRYNTVARLPNLIIGASIVHLSDATASDIVPPWPKLVIGAGRRTVPVARFVKSRADHDVFLAQCMWPGPPTDSLDLIAVPQHDDPPPNDKLVVTVGAPGRVGPAQLAEAERTWRSALGDLPTPRVALLVGGDTKRYRFSVENAANLGRVTRALAGAAQGSIMVTTSRRTAAAAKAALYAALPETVTRYDWGDDAGDNPYLGFLAHADAIVVTGDSTAMCTEACSTGRPVYVFAPAAHTAAKHKRLHELLYRRGYARPLPVGDTKPALETWRYDPLNDAAQIAEQIEQRLSAEGRTRAGA